MSHLPIIGVTACSWQIGQHAVQINDTKYSQAVCAAAKGLPVILPVLADMLDPAEIIHHLDGLLFTNAPSDIEPHLYGGPPSPPGMPCDPARDQLTLPLWRAALKAGLPVLGICLGLREMNVAYGGTLHQRLDPPAPSTSRQAMNRLNCNMIERMPLLCSRVAYSPGWDWPV